MRSAAMSSAALRPVAVGVLTGVAAGVAGLVVVLPADGSFVAALLGGSTARVGDLGLLVTGVAVCWAVFTLWPSTVLPTAVITVTNLAGLFGDGSIRAVMGVHALVLVAGAAGLITRRLLFRHPEARCRTVADVPMAVAALVIVTGAGYGLLLGNAPFGVMLAGYHFAVIPAYYFLATYTLNTPARLRSAAVLFVSASALLIVTSLAAPGRHGGVWALVIALPLLVISCRTTGWRRIGLVAIAALHLMDVALAAYRTTWVATGVAVLVLLLRGDRAVRRMTAATVLASTTLLVGVFALSSGVRIRAESMDSAFDRDAGFRVPEAMVGLRVFLHHPILGGGIGQVTPQAYLSGRGFMEVGPLYHVYHVMILANLGLVGLAALLWPLIRTLRVGLAFRSGPPFAFAALICGFIVAVAFSGPTTGHWTLGLLPALVLLTMRWGMAGADAPAGHPPAAAVPAVGGAAAAAPRQSAEPIDDGRPVHPVFMEAR
ncbi:O-antigen ligase family protein [Plantactinospora siamensis]|uniref:O-antigen ligase family protein n=1 Tax=Plantactinospora siamensis TaxID=555372 RepID=A0ABV6P447_9ACTN